MLLLKRAGGDLTTPSPHSTLLRYSSRGIIFIGHFLVWLWDLSVKLKVCTVFCPYTKKRGGPPNLVPDKLYLSTPAAVDTPELYAC